MPRLPLLALLPALLVAVIVTPTVRAAKPSASTHPLTPQTATRTATEAVDGVLDDWHKAAADADESRYFGYAAPDFVFLGTDASERWDLTSFRAFAHPHFAKGKAWTFLPKNRHVMLSPAGDVAWFDEQLDSASYGLCRGTGVLRRIDGRWKIAHYNLTIPIPNSIAKNVVEEIRRNGGKP